MEANFQASWSNSSPQQQELNRRILGNPPCFTQEETVWGCPAFYPRFRRNCDALTPYKCCQPLPPYHTTSQVPIFVPRETPKSHCFESEKKAPFFLNAKTMSTSLENPSSPRIKEIHQRNWCVTSNSLSPIDPRLKMVSKTSKHECHIPGCGKKYERSSHLKAHLRWHGNPAPFKCKSSSCGKRFSSLGKLEDHKKMHENDSSQKTELIL